MPDASLDRVGLRFFTLRLRVMGLSRRASCRLLADGARGQPCSGKVDTWEIAFS